MALVGHWKLIEQSGTVINDSSENTNTGTWTGTGAQALTSVKSTPGRGLLFDGIGDFVDIGNSALSAKTVSLWIKQSDIAGNEFPIDLNGTDYLSVVSGVVTINGFTAPLLYVDGVLGTSGVTTIIADKWHHIAITDTTAATTSDMDIGRVTAAFFDGSISEVRIFDTVLSAAKVSSIYENGITPYSRSRNAGTVSHRSLRRRFSPNSSL